MRTGSFEKLFCISRRSAFLGLTGFAAAVGGTAVRADQPDAGEEQIVVIKTEEDLESAEHRANKLWLGVQLKGLEGDLARYLGRDDGILIASVYDDSPASKAGIKIGDVLIEVGGQQLSDPKSLLKIMSKLDGDSAEPLSVKLLRRGEEKLLEVTPTAPPEHVVKSIEHANSQEYSFTIDSDEIGEGNMDLLLRKLGNKPLSIMRFGSPSLLLDRSKNATANMDINIVQAEDGKRMEIRIQREDDEPAEIKVTTGDEVHEYTEAELDKMPEEVRVVVEPLLEGKRRVRVFTKPMMEHVLSIVGENGEKTELIEKAHAAARQRGEEIRKRSEEYAKRLHARIGQSGERQGKASEVDELRKLVEELRAEVQQLREETKVSDDDSI